MHTHNHWNACYVVISKVMRMYIQTLIIHILSMRKIRFTAIVAAIAPAAIHPLAIAPVAVVVDRWFGGRRVISLGWLIGH